MPFNEFLTPVSFELRELGDNNKPFSISDLLKWSIDDEVNKGDIALLSIPEYQGLADNTLIEDEFFEGFRKQFYQLQRSNWKTNIYDLGTIIPGATFEDSCFALHQVVSKLIDSKMTVIVLGGNQSLTYTLYKSFNKDLINVATLDYKLDIATTSENLNADNHVTKMIMDDKNRMLNFVNIGSQIPYNAKEELDIIEQLNFDDIRLGDFMDNNIISEPALREVDLISLDLNSIQSNNFRSNLNNRPNGFTNREICNLMKYSGLGKNQLIFLSNYLPYRNKTDDSLLAEIIWYFIEAKNNLKPDTMMETYRVQFDDSEIVFLKSKTSQRWWIEVLVDGMIQRVPCNESDYLETMKGELPNVWLRYYKKFY